MKILNFKATKFFLLTLLVSLSACTKNNHTPTISQAPQSEACGELNLVRDASWTSGFVKSFVSCLSDGKEGSREKFALTLSVMDKLGSDALQASLDMLKWEYQGKEVFLGMTSSLLDRGASTDSDKRWKDTQALLEDTKPYAFINLMFELKKRDLLNPLLDVLESTDALLPEGFLESGIRQFLSDELVRKDAEVLIRSFLADAEAFEAFNSFLTPERRALSANCESDTACPYAGATEMKSSAQHWLDFWAGLSESHREHLAQAMAELVKGTLEQENLPALDRANRLLALGVQTVARSNNVYSQAHEAITVLLDTPLTSYDPFIQGLNRIKDNPIYLDAFQEKMGSGTLQDMVEEFIWKGGQPKSCSAKITGIIDGKDEPSRHAIMNALLKPHAACGGRVPFLMAMSEFLGYECAQSTCSISLIQDTAPADYQALMSYFLQKSEDSLVKDPYAFYRLGASRRDISNSVWKEIAAVGRGINFKSGSDLLNYEASMSARYPSHLPMNWLEISLDRTLLDLSSLEQSFAHVFPDRDPIEQWYYSDADPQLARLIFGLYPEGAADQAQAKLFGLDQLQKDWLASHPNSKIMKRDLAQIASPLRSLNAQFRSPAGSFKPEAEKISLPWLGGTKNTISFGRDGKTETSGDALKLSLLYDETEAGLGLRARYKEQLALATSSFPIGEAEEFRRWMTDEWLPNRSALVASQTVSSASLPVQLFDRQALTVEEARMLPLFMGQQFVKEMAQIPAGSLVNAQPETNVNPKSQAPRSLSGPSSLGGSDHPWTTFWIAKNESTSPRLTSLQALRDSIAPDANVIRNELTLQATAPVLVSQGLLDAADAEKLSDHEKLLLQLGLVSPILENRGKQFFVPSIGFANYCPQKNGQSWQAAACPFQYSNFDQYRKFVQDRFATSLCSMLPDGDSSEMLSAMGISDSSSEAKQFCSSYPSTLRWPKSWLDTSLSHTLKMGKNPMLRPALKAIPSELRWAKAQRNQDPKQIVKAYLRHTPILDGSTSTKVLQRLGNYEAFFSNLPAASSVWLLYLSQDIGLRGLAESLKRLGNSPVQGSEKPIEDFLNLITVSYEAAKANNETTLMFAIRLLNEIAS
ncbi:MAG: hypothetical protein EOP07_09815, partial [Proteobacteria bacterium]